MGLLAVFILIVATAHLCWNVGIERDHQCCEYADEISIIFSFRGS